MFARFDMHTCVRARACGIRLFVMCANLQVLYSFWVLLLSHNSTLSTGEEVWKEDAGGIETRAGYEFLRWH